MPRSPSSMLGLAAAAGYWFGMSHPQAPSPGAPAAEGTGDRKVLVLVRPDVPAAALRQAGQVALHGHDAGARVRRRGGRRVRRQHQSAQSRRTSAFARRGRGAESLAPKLAAVGNAKYNERAVVLVQTRTAGFVEKLHVRAPLDPVREGEPLVEILFPEWAARRPSTSPCDVSPVPTWSSLQRAARERLLLLGYDRGAGRGRRARRQGAGAGHAARRRCPAWSPNWAHAKG